MGKAQMPWIAIVGAGPAGLSAAIAAQAAGCRVTLIDEAPQPGGQIYRQADPGLGEASFLHPAEAARKKALLQRFDHVRDKIDLRLGWVAQALFEGPELHVSPQTEGAIGTANIIGDVTHILKPDAVILATGVSEQAVPFPGWTLPGVIYAGGAQALLKGNLVRPGGRALVAGLGPLPLAVASQLLAAGVEIAAVALFHPLNQVLSSPGGLWAGKALVREGLAYGQALKAADVPILQGWMPLRAEGEESLEAIELAPHQDGRPVRSSARRFEVDLLAINFGFLASGELARMAGASCHDRGARGGWVVDRDDEGQTSIDGVYLAGDCAGLRGALVATAEGEILATRLAARLTGKPQRESAPARRALKQQMAFQKALDPLFILPPSVSEWANGDTLICRCEGVDRTAIEACLAKGHQSLDAIKRNTRAGMGWCQGRSCLRAVAMLAGDTSKPMRARPLARPVSLRALALETQERCDD